MTVDPQGPVVRGQKHFLPWRHDSKKASGGGHAWPYFEARYKRRYILPMSLFMFSFVWMGISIIDQDMSEMFFAMFPFVIVPLVVRYTGFALAMILAMAIPFLIYFGWPELVDVLGKIIVVIMFGICFPLLGFLSLYALFDSRPQLLVGPDGICCRQHSDDLIPWEDITWVSVVTHEHRWPFKVRILTIDLRDFSCYPKPTGKWTPQHIVYGLSKMWKKPEDSASVGITTFLLDPPLPFVMKAIKHYRPKPVPKRARSRKS